MTRLHDLQDGFVRAIWEENAAIISEEIIPDGLTPQERYNIYRNNTFITLGEALKQNFPVMLRLVGQKFFDQLARQYIGQYPPETPILLSYGANMADFLAQFPPVSDLPYLGDVARLEHLWNSCFNGPDAPVLDTQRLSAVAPELFHNLIFDFLSNMQLLASPYPILDIWLANQGEERPSREIDLASGGCHMVLFRPGQEVEIMRLDQPSFDFLTNLQERQTLGEVTEAVMEQYPDFNLLEAVQNILHGGIIQDFEIIGNGDLA